MNMQEIYDKDYFENGIATKKSNYRDYSWERLGSYFQATAKHIVKCFKPETSLDVGTAKGFLPYALSELGVEACGIDVSEYAISNAKGDVRLGAAQDIEHPTNGVDVVTAFDVMEHISEKEVPKVCNELLRVAKKYVVVRVPTKDEKGDLDAYHETIKPREWWEEQFAKQGGKVIPNEKFIDKGIWWFNIPEYLIVVEKQEKEAEKPKPKKTQRKKEKKVAEK